MELFCLEILWPYHPSWMQISSLLGCYGLLSRVCSPVGEDSNGWTGWTCQYGIICSIQKIAFVCGSCHKFHMSSTQVKIPSIKSHTRSSIACLVHLFWRSCGNCKPLWTCEKFKHPFKHLIMLFIMTHFDFSSGNTFRFFLSELVAVRAGPAWPSAEIRWASGPCLQGLTGFVGIPKPAWRGVVGLWWFLYVFICFYMFSYSYNFLYIYTLYVCLFYNIYTLYVCLSSIILARWSSTGGTTRPERFLQPPSNLSFMIFMLLVAWGLEGLRGWQDLKRSEKQRITETPQSTKHFAQRFCNCLSIQVMQHTGAFLMHCYLQRGQKQYSTVF